MDQQVEPKPASRLRSGVMLLVLGLAGYWGWDYYQSGLQFEETDNAYLGAHVVQVSSRVAGLLVQLPVENHQQVSKGDLLFAVDDRPYRLAVEALDGRLKQSRQSVGGDQAAVAAARSRVQQKSVRVENARANLQRLSELSNPHFVSAQTLDNAKTELAAAQAELREAEADLNQSQQKIQLIENRNPQLQENAAQLEQARLDLQNTQTLAPVSGTIANLSVRPGSYVQVGQPLLALIDQRVWWVDANFKETQLSALREGQAVSVRIDSCADVALEGVVEHIGSGTGAAFSLLPPQNANSNWVKVTQRVPVRIRLNGRSPDCRLIIGISASVRVQLR